MDLGTDSEDDTDAEGQNAEDSHTKPSEDYDVDDKDEDVPFLVTAVTASDDDQLSTTDDYTTTTEGTETTAADDIDATTFEQQTEDENEIDTTVTPQTTTTETSEPTTEDAESAVSRNVCQKPLDRGSCSSKRVRYFYNPVKSRCENFGACPVEGDVNNFATKEECIAKCQPDLDTPFVKV